MWKITTISYTNHRYICIKVKNCDNLRVNCRSFGVFFFISASTFFNIFLHLLHSSSSLFSSLPSTSNQRSPSHASAAFILVAPSPFHFARASFIVILPRTIAPRHWAPQTAVSLRPPYRTAFRAPLVVSFLRALQHFDQPPSGALSSSRAPHCQDPSPTARSFSPSPLALFLLVTTSAAWKSLRASLLLSYTRRKNLHHTHTARTGARCLPKP